MKKVLLLCNKDFPGAVSILKNLAAVTNTTFKPFNEINYTTIQQYDHVIIGGWEDSYLSMIKRFVDAGTPVSVLWCSSLGQLEMTPRLIEIKMFNDCLLLVSRGIITYFFANRSISDALAWAGLQNERFVFLPATLDLTVFDKQAVVPFDLSTPLDQRLVGYFCQYRYGKNALNQLLAATTPVITNCQEQSIVNLAQALTGNRIDVIHWIESKEDYYQLIKSLYCSLQVTFTESLNYAAVEHMLLGVPTIVPYSLTFIADSILQKYLCVANLDSPREIGERITALQKDVVLRNDLGCRCREFLQRYFATENQLARSIFESLFGGAA